MSRPTTAARRSRMLLTGYFLGLGVVMAIWGARMPAVPEQPLGHQRHPVRHRHRLRLPGHAG
ncbi:hypothetical protein AB0O04_37535, partial [Streptomyces althioticus]|uniref:hypothetical protein n=1 Tax=Streptomyces althioticus TaxID=83380 RepID=UPI00343EE63E